MPSLDILYPQEMGQPARNKHTDAHPDHGRHPYFRLQLRHARSHPIKDRPYRGYRTLALPIDRLWASQSRSATGRFKVARWDHSSDERSHLQSSTDAELEAGCS